MNRVLFNLFICEPADKRLRYLGAILSVLAVVVLAIGSTLLFDVKHPGPAQPAALRAISAADLGRFALWCAAWTALIWVIRQAARGAARLRIDETTPRRQEAAVAAAAIIGTVLAFLPIIFLHQSLLGPGNGSFPFFYTYCPFVPGPSDCRAEAIHGADTGAMAWAFFPAVVVQEQAIKQFGEFPLWNRYDSSGITMLGQGQMMLGDPLNWLQWLVGVDALSFDMKFLFLRAVFAAALGLSVLAVTKALRPSLVVAFAAPFIGFFIYRLNHPTIFSLCYAPLISLAWLRLTCSTDPRARFWWLAGLMAADWLVLNSGTVKEAYMLLLTLNAIGAVHFLIDGRRLGRQAYWSLILMLGVSGVCFAAISLPVVGTLLESLRHAITLYDIPSVVQLPVWQALVFVDSYFHLLTDDSYVVASNALLFSGFCAAILFIRGFAERRLRLATLIFALGAAVIFTIAFGAMPADVLIAIPFINNIQHTDSTFATLLIVPTSIVAGFGFHLIDQRIAKAGIGRILAWIGLAYAFLCLLFVLGFVQNGGLNPIRFSIYAAVVLTAGVVAPWLILNLTQSRLTFLGVAVCVLAALLVLGRGASYPPVRASGSFFEPAQRMNLTKRPAIVERLAPILAAEPARVTGVDYFLGPGYNAAIGLEGISGPDAVMLRSYRELTMALNLPYLWSWGIAFDPKSLTANARALDFLDVKYVVSPEKLSGLDLVDREPRALLFRRNTAWPRAFFTDKVEAVDSLAAFAGRVLEGTPGPFVAIGRSDANAVALASKFEQNGDTTGHVVRATAYSLTANSTSFTITAPSAGVAYLGETDVPGDFEVSVNGRPAPYFSANYAFKAVALPGPGTYRITFRYWPAHLTSYLGIAAAGAVLWVGAMGLFWRYLRRRAGLVGTAIDCAKS